MIRHTNWANLKHLPPLPPNSDTTILLVVTAATTVVAQVLPEIEDPWPDSIGLDFPFTVAGAGAVLGLVVAHAQDRSSKGRDKFVRRLTVVGFAIGTAIYLVALIAQLLGVSL